MNQSIDQSILFKVIDCDFLLVVNSDLGRISHGGKAVKYRL